MQWKLDLLSELRRMGTVNWVERPTNVQVRQGTLGFICFDKISQLEFVICKVD
jgi:hypothetical protein